MPAHPSVRLLARLLFAVGLVPAAASAQARYDLLVSSRATNSVKRFDGETGAYLGDFIANGTGGLSLTQEVRQGPDGNIYVTGRGNSAVLRFDRRTGAFLGPFTKGYSLDEPTKTNFGPDGRLYVSQWGQTKSTVAVFDGTTGDFIREATPALNQPMQQLFEPSGGILVATYGGHQVLRFAADGSPGGSAVSGKALQGPVNLWRHPSGDLLVMDWQAGSVERFDGATGAFRSTFVSGLTTAEGWAIGPDGALFLADWSRNLILRYDATTGAALGEFASGGGLTQPNSLIFVERFPDFGLDVQPRTVSRPDGMTADVRVIVAADRGLAFPDPVALGCSGLPAGWACQFARPTAAPGTTADTVGLVVKGPAVAAADGSLAWWLVGPGLLLVLVIGLPPRRQLARTAILIGAAGCGGGATPPVDESVTATVTITGSAAGLTRSTQVTVTLGG
ncbi:MAG: hypothetical protein AB7L66_13925 [Gemmatimonadales bacterium]